MQEKGKKEGRNEGTEKYGKHRSSKYSKMDKLIEAGFGVAFPMSLSRQDNLYQSSHLAS